MNVELCSDRRWILSEEAFKLYASCMYHPRYEDFKNWMESYLNDPSVRIVVCERDGRKTGMLVLKCSGAAAEITGIAVAENVRQQGIGKRMIQFVMESSDVEQLKAETDDDAVEFYRKCGFSMKKIAVDYPDGSAVRYDCIVDKQTMQKVKMKYKGTLIVVKDCDRALAFYRDMFGLQLVHDNDGNMELTGGLYLQEARYWETFLQQTITSRNNSTELYFEETDIGAFVEKLEKLYPNTEYVNRLMTHSWGQRVVRFYDPDGNLIEVGTPV